VHKQDLNELLKIQKPVHHTYKTGRILAKHGDSVLWVPPYYPGLNLIELILVHTTVKNWVADRNVTIRVEDAIKLTEEKLDSTSREHQTKM
jgi:hypothetical protein